MDISGLHNFSEIYGEAFKTSCHGLVSSELDRMARQTEGPSVRNFFRSAPPPNIQAEKPAGPETNNQDSAIRRVEITVERETVSLHFPAGTVGIDGEQRCPCCGHVLSRSQPVCAALEPQAVKAIDALTPVKPADEMK
jgi:hypothetical protein